MAKSTKQNCKQSYTPEIAEEICQRLMAGESLTGVCEDSHMPDTDTVMQWFTDDVEGFQARYLEVFGAVVMKNIGDIPSLPLTLPSKALAAQVLANMGVENHEAIITQLAEAGALLE